MKETIFAEKLRKLLFENKITQKELAENLGVHKQVIANWLSGYRNPKTDNIKKLAEIFNKPLSYFIDDLSYTREITPISEVTMKKLPVIATVPCGNPEFSLLDEKNIEDFLPVPVALFPDADYVVKCVGESMIPEIMPSALCIVEKIDVPLNNKNMLIKTELGSTIKRVLIKNGKPTFWYLNPKGKQLKAQNVIILGKVIGSYMKY